MYRAAAALPYDDPDRATAGLCSQLRVMAVAGEATPDWSTLTVHGPTGGDGPEGRAWFEWTATVVVDGGVEISEEALDVFPTDGRRPQVWADEETAALPRVM